MLLARGNHKLLVIWLETPTKTIHGKTFIVSKRKVLYHWLKNPSMVDFFLLFENENNLWNEEANQR